MAPGACVASAGLSDRGPPSTEREATMCEPKEKKPCLRPNCGRPAHSRGLCRYCYKAADTLIKQGRTTWERLEKRGRISHNKVFDFGPAKRCLMG